jgi:hypothetical protein
MRKSDILPRGLLCLTLATLLHSGSAAAALPEPGLHRFTANLRPFARNGAGGLISDLGYEYMRGINAGVELSPITLGQAAYSSFAVRVKLGYAGRYFAIGATLSSGYPAFFPELGPAFRFGRLDKAYIYVRAAWMVSPAVRLPIDAALELRVPVTKKVALRLDGTGGYTSTHPFIVYGSLGIGYTLRGNGLNNTTILNVGAGPVYFGSLGGAGLVGVEHRL